MSFGADLESDLDLFLGVLCTDWGFCSDLKAAALMKGRTSIEAHQFARAVLEAEGMKPDREPSWMRRIKRAFVQRYHDHAITADEYREAFGPR